ncbi:MAG: hypothetical protein JSS93_05280 [Bacteroidetes bacterium]|nr:hypothetical protein [Bacteroidota bacterium]
MNKTSNRIKIKLSVLFNSLFWLLLSVSCSKEKKELGYLFFVDPDYWYFVPVKSINKTLCVDDFKSSNLKTAIQFQPFFKNRFYVQETLDTVEIESDKKKINYNPNHLKITPVEMEYSNDETRQPNYKRDRFSLRLKKSTVEINCVFTPIKISKVTPIFCYKRKKSDVKICECKKSDDDPNDYLFKICTYLKSKGDISFQPCKYKVTKITESTYDGKKAIEVSLNCCYLGDRAYFDPQTKELIDFAYGAE